MSVIGGFQANKIGALELDVVPRGGVVVHVAPRVHVKALYSKAFRAPSINETRLNHPGLAGNPDMRPEKVGTFDLERAITAADCRAASAISTAARPTASSWTRATPRWQYRNLGEATFQGGEGSAKYYVHPNVLVLGSVLYQTSKDGQGNTHVTPVSNLGAKAGVSYESKLLTRSLFDSYQGNMDGFAGTVTPTANPGTGAYHMLSARGCGLTCRKLTRASRGIAFFVQGDNLTNKEVWHAGLGRQLGRYAAGLWRPLGAVWS